MNIYTLCRSMMKTSPGMVQTPADIYTAQGVRQSTPQSAQIITTPPTFTGITGLTPKTDGTINVQWGLASSLNPPVSFQIFVGLGPMAPSALFTQEPAILAPSGFNNVDVYKLSDNSTYLVNGSIYTFGVRAKDGLGNQNTNLTTMTTTAISSGNLIYLLQQLHANLLVDHSNFQADHSNFQGDHTNFQGDHSDLQSDHTNFGLDHVAFQADHTNFQADHVNFESDHSNLQGDHSNFQSDHSNLQSDHGNFQSDHSNFQADHSDYQSQNSTFTASNATYIGLLSTMNAMLIELGLELDDFSAKLLELGADISDINIIISDLESIRNTMLSALSQNAIGQVVDSQTLTGIIESVNI